jgi:hypothetical protein
MPAPVSGVEDRKAVIPRIILAACFGVFLLTPLPAKANLFPDLSKTIQEAQGPNDVTLPALQQGCDLSTALTSLITANDKDLSSSLVNLGTVYTRVSGGLNVVIRQKRYQKPIKLINLKLADLSVKPEALHTGDDLLIAILGIVDRSSTIIDKIQAGKGDADDLMHLVQNNGDITQLILAFYVSVRA